MRTLSAILSVMITPLQPDELLGGTHEAANIIPNSARALLRIVEERGLSATRLCRGLGFRHHDLVSRDLLLSYRQIRMLILRALRLCGEPALGIAAGARQSPVSWGLPGLAMLTFPTLGEAVHFALAHQIEAGALVEHRLVEAGQAMHIDVAPKVTDRQIEPFLVEESLAGALAVGRYLAGDGLRPIRVELSFDKEGHAEVCRRFFGCPVQFGSGRNRMTLEARWLGTRLRGYDPVTCEVLRARLASLIELPAGQHDLVESLANQLRFNAEEKLLQKDLAHTVNMSERTLRRRLRDQDVSYRTLRDSARHERAIDLLRNSEMSIAAISEAVGYGDARAFRRAFQRWTGKLPTEYRRGD